MLSSDDGFQAADNVAPWQKEIQKKRTTSNVSIGAKASSVHLGVIIPSSCLLWFMPVVGLSCYVCALSHNCVSCIACLWCLSQ